MRLISKIYKRLIDNEKALIGTKKENQLIYAAIHGTILSILIGLSSVYVVYFFNISNELEQNTVDEALRVNRIKPNSAWYEIFVFAKDYLENFRKWENYVETKGFPGAFTQDVLANRLINLINRKFSKDTTVVITKGKTKITFDWLSEFREKHGLSDIEEILCIMSIIRLSKPFKQILVEEPTGGIMFPGTFIFYNKSDVHSWLMSQRQISALRFETERYNLKEVLNSRKWPDGRLFVKMSENLSKAKNYAFEDFGLKLDAKIKSLPNDFIDDIIEISDIWYSTVSHMRRLNKVNEKMPSPFTVKIGLVLSIIAFFSAVLYPLTFPNVKPLFYIYVPIVFYTLYFGYILWVVVF